MECEHKNFEAEVDVNRLQEHEGGKVAAYAADIRIRCADCQTPMRFIGLDQGLSFRRPMSSIDGLELRAPLAVGPIPQDQWMNPQIFEVAPEKVIAEGGVDVGPEILASSDDEPAASPAEASDEEFERRAAEELTRRDSTPGGAFGDGEKGPSQ